MSAIFPLLSYGDESKQLMLAFMGIDSEAATEGVDVGMDSLLLRLDSALSDMLRVKRHSRQPTDETMMMTVGSNSNDNHSTKSQAVSNNQQSSSKSSDNTTKQPPETPILPWNVLLRMALRFTALTVEQIQSYKCGINDVSYHKQTVPKGNCRTTSNNQNDNHAQQELMMCKPATVTSSTANDGNNDTKSSEVKSITDINGMGLNDLRRELKHRNLAYCQGTKEELSERLKRAIDPNYDQTRDDNSTKDDVYNSMTYNELRSELCKHGLTSKGKKHELLRRLRQYLDEERLAESTVVRHQHGSPENRDNSTKAHHAEEVKSSTEPTFHMANLKSDDDQADESGEHRVHPLLQSLDNVISELIVMLRTRLHPQQQQRQQHQASLSSSIASESSNTPFNLNVMSINTQHQQSALDDRMICDWTNHPPTSQRLYCGPSRHALVKDAAYIKCNLDLKLLGMSAEELHEKIETIVGYIDEYVGFDCGDVSTRIGLSTPIKNQPSNTSAMLSSPTGCLFGASPLSSPLRRSPISSTSKLSGQSLANFTRSYVHRAIEKDKEAKRVALASLKLKDSSVNIDLKSSFEPIDEAEIIETDDIGRVQDAYRMALVFSENSSDECDKVKRRLELLAQQLNRPMSNKRGAAEAGADSYLRLLLRESLQPSDPDVWAGLMEQSQSKETPVLLRRGRSLLVSFLVAIKVPGWDDEHGLDPSPLADYLGFLSSGGGASKGNDQQHAMLVRSSFLLPGVDDEATSIPHPPIVTEIGLGSCISNFVEKEGSQATSGLDFVFGIKADNSPLAHLSESIALPLPNTSELTRDLFDLTLRLAANDDKEHDKKPYPLRLATPSASESLKIVLDAVSDYCQWLEPRSITNRYRLIMELIVTSFCSFGKNREITETHSYIESSWGERATSLIRIAKTVQDRARIAIYTTQFMLILCKKQKVEQLNGATSFYSRLHLQRFSQFWEDLERESSDDSTTVISRVFDFKFCINHILPISHQCSMFLARKSQLTGVCDNSISLNEQTESILFLITVLCSVFKLAHEDNLLVDCIHIGWAIEVLSLSIGFFTRGLKQISPWNRVLNELTNLYDSVWGYTHVDFHKFKSLNSPKMTSFTYIVSEKRRFSLMPSFDVIVASLVGFICSHESVDNNMDSNWCKFVSSHLLECYTAMLPNAVALSWMRSLARILRNEVIQQKVFEYKGSSIKRTDKEEDAATELVLKKLMNPLMTSLHKTIVTQHGLRISRRSKPSSATDCDIIAYTLSELYKEESNKILIKPSRFKTRKWHVYRACIEKVFISTPPAALFTSLGSSCLVDSSAETLREVCTCFGQSHFDIIMIAASLTVNESLGMMRYTNDDSIIRKLCDTFTAQATNCITSYFGPSNKSLCRFDEFATNVERYFHLHAAYAGLMWFDGVKSSLPSSLTSNYQQFDDAQASSKNKGTSNTIRDVKQVVSSLEKQLSAISHSDI